jgi:cofilin
MAMSGVKVNDACVKKWEELKMQKIKACNFKLSDNLKEIIVDEGSEIAKDTPGAWKQWASSLPDKECRYAIYDVEMKIDMGSGLPQGTRTKLVFVVWAPQSASIKQKMVSASSKDALKKKLDGVQVEWQLTGHDELEASDRIHDLQCLPDIKTSGNGIISFEGINA